MTVRSARAGERAIGPQAAHAREPLAPTAPATRLGRREAAVLAARVGFKGAAALGEPQRRKHRREPSAAGALEEFTTETPIGYKWPTVTPLDHG